MFNIKFKTVGRIFEFDKGKKLNKYFYNNKNIVMYKKNICNVSKNIEANRFINNNDNYSTKKKLNYAKKT